jgi:hypothetical protein
MEQQWECEIFKEKLLLEVFIHQLGKNYQQQFTNYVLKTDLSSSYSHENINHENSIS